MSKEATFIVALCVAVALIAGLTVLLLTGRPDAAVSAAMASTLGTAITAAKRRDGARTATIIATMEAEATKREVEAELKLANDTMDAKDVRGLTDEEKAALGRELLGSE